MKVETEMRAKFRNMLLTCKFKIIHCNAIIISIMILNVIKIMVIVVATISSDTQPRVFRFNKFEMRGAYEEPLVTAPWITYTSNALLITINQFVLGNQLIFLPIAKTKIKMNKKTLRPNLLRTRVSNRKIPVGAKQTLKNARTPKILNHT